jgi:hypothetical protein
MLSRMRGVGGKTYYTLWVGVEISANTMESRMEVLLKTKISFSITTPGHIPEGM